MKLKSLQQVTQEKPFKLATGNDYNAETHDISVEISDADGNSVDISQGFLGSVIDDSKEHEIKVMVYDECTTDLARGLHADNKDNNDNLGVQAGKLYHKNGAGISWCGAADNPTVFTLQFQQTVASRMETA